MKQGIRGSKDKYQYSFASFIKANASFMAVLTLLNTALLIALIVYSCLEGKLIYDLLIALVTFLGTSLLSTITIWQQERFHQYTAWEEEKRNFEEGEDKRLSFMPCLAVEKSVDASIEIEEITELYDVDEKRSMVLRPSDSDKNPISKLNSDESVMHLCVAIKNIGRDSALGISMQLDNAEAKQIFSLTKGDSYRLVLKKRINGLTKIDFKFRFSYFSLDKHKYVQFENISFYDRRSDDGQDHLWKMESSDPSFPILEQGGNKQ